MARLKLKNDKMMKKLLLFLSVGVMVNGAFAQKASNTSIMVSSVPKQRVNVDDKTVSLKDVQKQTSWRYDNSNSRSASKTTISGTRTYNYVDYLDILGTPSGSFPLMWQDGEGMMIYQPSQGVYEYDTSFFMSYGGVLHPWIAGFNDPFALDYSGKVGIQSYSPYVVDSVAFYGLYQRNSQKHNIKDTLRVSLIYGNGGTGQDVRIAQWWLVNSPGTWQNRYGSDTLRVATVRYDSVRRVAQGTTRIIKDIILDNSNAYDTLGNGLNRFVVPFGQSIPAGNLVAATATFVSGDPNIPAPYTDTIFRGTSVPGLDFTKFNIFRPWTFEETDGQYPKYYNGNYNTGLGMLRVFDTGNSFYDTYLAAWFWAENGGVEYPYMDWVITCPDCPAVGVDEVQGLISNVKVYPNPAVTEARVPFALGTASDVNVTLTNVMGQVISRQSFNNVLTGEAVFSTSQLTNGVYLINVEAGGQNRVERVTVAH